MTEPDDLYTLRALFWLGHYGMCLDEAKTIGRRSGMNSGLKTEKEEFVLRAHLALQHYDKVMAEGTSGDPGIQALVLRAKYETASSDDAKNAVVDELKSLLASNPTTSVQLTASHVFLIHASTRDALQCVHLGITMEHILVSLQIYLKMDRLDLAQQSLQMLQQADEDSILTQLGSVYCMISAGSSRSADAVHILQSLSEQYGPSPYLMNLTSASYMVSGNYGMAERSLNDCRAEFGDAMSNSQRADTLINLLVCHEQQAKSSDTASLMDELKESYPSHPFCAGVERVTTALERESLKYRV